MTSTYGHFCLAARTLETVGDRWSLLIVRDLLAGPRRFSDLRYLLTNVTPKLLTKRLRQLERDGIARRNQQAGRREVWYELTEKGRDLAPVIDALLAWGVKHERHPLAPDEAAHPEHLGSGLRVALENAGGKPPRRCIWRFEFSEPEGSFTLRFDGRHWLLDERSRRADVVVSTTPRAWADFVTRSPTERRLPSPEIRLRGAEDRVADLIAAFRAGPNGRS
jgi:DNA-binding HxlR family transcriptional regulator